MKRWYTGLLLALVACGGNSPLTYSHFKDALDKGAACDRLFEIRNEVKRTSGEFVQTMMNDDLRRVECHGADAKRTDHDRPPGTENLMPGAYKAAFTTCDADPERVMEQAATNDPEVAAHWLAEGSTAGSAYEGSYRGCLDALEGKPSRFGE